MKIHSYVRLRCVLLIFRLALDSLELYDAQIFLVFSGKEEDMFAFSSTNKNLFRFEADTSGGTILPLQFTESKLVYGHILVYFNIPS